jgi:hypothetical protein
LDIAPHPEGMREQSDVTMIDLSHPFRMQSSFPMVPGVSAALQPLATFSNPFGGKGLHLFLKTIIGPEVCKLTRRIDEKRNEAGFLFSNNNGDFTDNFPLRVRSS